MARGGMLVYLDNASSTRVDPRVLEAMKPYFLEHYAAPTSAYGHTMGVKAREAVEESRGVIAKSIGAEPEEIIFTSGATESNNLAIKGAVGVKCVITSEIEHSSVLGAAESLRRSGVKVVRLGVDGEGFISLERLREELEKAERPCLVSIQHANQEIGTTQPIEEVGRLCREYEALLHVDATQSFTKLPINVKEMNIDLLTTSAHVIHGPKGVGALYVRHGVKLAPLLDGAFNEFGLRPGTENVPGIVGFAKAVEIADESQVSYMRGLRDHLMKGLLEIPDSRLNGPRGDRRLCNNVNVTFRYVEGESLMLHLDMRGITITTGSACFSPTLTPSHVILALGLKHEDAHGSARFTLSKYNTREEMDYTIESVADVVKLLRSLSPVGRG